MTGFALPARRPRPLGILVASFLLAAGTLVAAGITPPARPDGAPAPAAPVTIPGAGIPVPASGSLAQLDRNIAAWTANLAANSNDFLAATNLAALYQGRARLTGDLADHERALEAARVALRIDAGHAPARALEASILFSLHDFAAARAAADGLVRDDPTQLGALATRADAALELGDLEAARADLDHLAEAAPGPAVDIRLARLAAVSGDLEGALELARGARDAAVAADRDPGFYEYALGEYGRLAGDPATARTGYQAALAIRPTDLGALLGMARIEAFEGDLEAAIQSLERAVAIAPTPEAEALLGDLLTLRGAEGDLEAAAVAHGTVRLTAELSALAGSVYDRQLLAFDLDHPVDGFDPAAAVAAARAGLEARPDAGGHALLAWALHRAGRDAEAWTAIEAARATGAADATLLFRAGAIAAALGDARVARDLLGQALALGPALDPAQWIEAQVVLAALDE